MNNKIDKSKLPSIPDAPETTSFYGPEKETEELKKELEKVDENTQAT